MARWESEKSAMQAAAPCQADNRSVWRSRREGCSRGGKAKGVIREWGRACPTEGRIQVT